MKTVRFPGKLQSIVLGLKKKRNTIGLVPTMGALHDGHLSLVRRARKENDIVIVSIFVNPAQFGPNEDYLRYPRPFERDRRLLQKNGVDLLFVPKPEDMYPEGYATYITVEGMSGMYCGASRPGHFRGVATVVAKLFNSTQPDRAYFGEKDFQQITILRRMVRDLNMPVKIVPCPIVRERSGLALSSRNQYLSGAGHEESARISQALFKAQASARTGAADAGRLLRSVRSEIKKIPGSRVEYAAIVDAETLAPLKAVKRPARLLVAVRVGKTRLIDNISLL